MPLPLMWEITVFCAVVEKRSFVAAARLLGRSPSTITRALQNLEHTIGHSLLQRSQKTVSLTAAGESYYGYAKQLLAMQTEAEDQLAGLDTLQQGWVRFAAPESLSIQALPKLMSMLTQHHPNLFLDVHFTDEVLDPIKENLDFVIRGSFPQSSELIGFPLWNYTRHMYASPAYVERCGLPIEPHELREHDVILHTSPRILSEWLFVSHDASVRLKVDPRLRMSSGVAVFHATQQGAGIARLGSWLAEPAVQQGRLVKVCPQYRITSNKGLDPQMHAVYAVGRQAKRVRLVLDALKKLDICHEI
jgi:DNA-binding transcriptional LysR family regulator